ncbi:MAG: hypothetical protein ACRC6I_09975 [Paracoccaceae bacterium]
MCGGCSPPPPSGDVPGNPPGGSAGGTGLCCACPANGTVSTDGFTNYYTTTYGTSDPVVNKCSLAIQRTATGGSVTITKTFSLAYANGATEALHKGTVTANIASAMAAWQSAAGTYRIIVDQPGCSQQKLNILYTSTIVASGGDVVVTVDNRPAEVPALRSGVSGGTAMDYYLNEGGDIAWTMIHEIGHTFGLEDEYIFTHPSSTPPSFTYKGADNPDKTITLTASTIPPETAGTFSFDNASVMGEADNTVFVDYHFYWIAIEVKKIMQAAGASAVVKVGLP